MNSLDKLRQNPEGVAFLDACETRDFDAILPIYDHVYDDALAEAKKRPPSQFGASIMMENLARPENADILTVVGRLGQSNEGIKDFFERERSLFGALERLLEGRSAVERLKMEMICDPARLEAIGDILTLPPERLRDLRTIRPSAPDPNELELPDGKRVHVPSFPQP